MDLASRRWPLPQTQQMWLEHELLRDPALPGVFSFGTTYRRRPPVLLATPRVVGQHSALPLTVIAEGTPTCMPFRKRRPGETGSTVAGPGSSSPPECIGRA